MKTLSSTLESAQQASSLEPAIKLTLSKTGEDDVVYTETRILSISHQGEPYRQGAEVLLDNSDNVLTSLDFKGWQAVISYGLVTSAGKEYSDTAPLWVIHQQLSSAPGKLTCELRMVGIPNMLAEDRASESYIPRIDPETEEYIPAGSGTKKVKTLLSAIIGATHTGFTHCHAYDVVYDSEDDLIDSYKPKEGFRIYTNGSRLACIRRLLDFTKCMMRIGNDGKIHILQPATSGDYDYQYSLESGHTFFSKAYRKTLVLPNYIVVKSNKNDDPQYSGSAQDSGSINAFREVRQYLLTRLEDDDEADDIAEAILSKYQLNAEMGAADVPMNCGAELFDYIKVTDKREDNDYRVGNIGSLTRTYNAIKRVYNMRFSFGGWLTVRALASNLEVYPDGIEQYIDIMFIEKLYAQYIISEQIDVGYLSALTAKMGLLTSGEIRVGTGDFDKDGGTATGGSTTTLEDSGQSWEIDQLKGKAIRILIDPAPELGNYPYYETSIASNTADTITLAVELPVSVSSGDAYYLGAGDFTGWRFWTEWGIGRMAGFCDGVIQFYVGSDGKLYAGGGAIYLDALGLHVLGDFAFFYDDDGNIRGSIHADADTFYITAHASKPMYLTSAEVHIGSELYIPSEAA